MTQRLGTGILKEVDGCESQNWSKYFCQLTLGEKNKADAMHTLAVALHSNCKGKRPEIV